jgi:hypothetical protein
MSFRGLGVAVVALVGSLFVFGAAGASADSCPNAMFRTGPSAGLPDCRAYEMVTPSFKSGGEPFVETGNGSDGVLVRSLAAFGEALADSGFEGTTYIATRSASGWMSQPITPPRGRTPQDVSQDLSRTLWVMLPDSPAYRFDLRFYIRHADGSLVEVGPLLPPAAMAVWKPGDYNPEETGEVTYKGGSADLSHVLFSVQPASDGVSYLWPGLGGEISQGGGEDGESLYEYVGSGNSSPRQVGVDNSGHLIGHCGSVLGGGDAGGTYNAVSASGSRVFFTTNCGLLTKRELYARIDGAETTAISEPSVGDCAACDTSPGRAAKAIFQGASRDGSRVFFLTSQPLLDGDSTQNLYVYDFTAPAGQRVVRVSSGDPAGANVERVVRISEDGSHVYFLARGVLTGTANASGEHAVQGESNLYVYEPDPAHPGQFKTAFIAQWSGGQTEVTPDGRFLLLTSASGLTPDCAVCSGEELYRYDAQTSLLVRISIGENGFDGNGTQIPFAQISATGRERARAEPRWVSISDDGSYVFFQSPAALTENALNDVLVKVPTGQGAEEYFEEYLENVYEYHEGHVYLISDGRDTKGLRGGVATHLQGASPSGSDVFFATADQLVAQDTDTLPDYYDARIGGGFPAPPAAVSCQGEACQGGLSVAPSGQVPGSVSFTGPGNPVPVPAAAKKKSVSKHHAKRKPRAGRRRAKRHAKARRTTGKGR